MSDGDAANILVDATGTDDILPVVRLIGSVLTCRFHGSNASIVARTPSLPVSASRHFIDRASVLIRCPAPNATAAPWQAVSLELRPPLVSQLSPLQRATAPIAVTRPAGSEQAQHYELSVCSATSRASRKHLVEWIEYHALQGVDHFYLYDTASHGQGQGRLQHVLQDYVSKGAVTVVPWPYDNCMHGMASGRNVGWATSLNPVLGPKFFQPPPRIAQTAALASCYVRFRSSTRYMTSIDDDEFLLSKMRTLKSFVKGVFKRFPEAPALYLRPIMITACPPRAAELLPQFNGSLPRLGGTRQFAELTLQYEGKLVMRTAAVEMFHVHYVTQVRGAGAAGRTTNSSDGDGVVGGVARRWTMEDVVTAHPHKAAVLHYKDSLQESGSVFGGELPVDPDQVMAKACKGSVIDLDPSSGSRAKTVPPAAAAYPPPSSFFAQGFNFFGSWPRESVDPTKHYLSATVAKALVENFKRRMAEFAG